MRPPHTPLAKCRLEAARRALSAPNGTDPIHPNPPPPKKRAAVNPNGAFFPSVGCKNSRKNKQLVHFCNRTQIIGFCVRVGCCVRVGFCAHIGFYPHSSAPQRCQTNPKPQCHTPPPSLCPTPIPAVAVCPSVHPSPCSPIAPIHAELQGVPSPCTDTRGPAVSVCDL